MTTANVGRSLAVIMPDDPDLKLRPSGPEDDELARQLFAASRTAAFIQAGLHGAMLDNMLDQQFRLQADAYAKQFPGAQAFVIERRDSPVGRLLLHQAEHRWHMVDISLRQSCCGQGIGTAVLAGIEIAARMRNVNALALAVRASNPGARRFYRRLGFTETAAVAGGAYLNMIKQLAPDIIVIGRTCRGSPSRRVLFAPGRTVRS